MTYYKMQELKDNSTFVKSLLEDDNSVENVCQFIELINKHKLIAIDDVETVIKYLKCE